MLAVHSHPMDSGGANMKLMCWKKHTLEGQMDAAVCCGGFTVCAPPRAWTEFGERV